MIERTRAYWAALVESPVLLVGGGVVLWLVALGLFYLALQAVAG